MQLQIKPGLLCLPTTCDLPAQDSHDWLVSLEEDCGNAAIAYERWMKDNVRGRDGLTIYATESMGGTRAVFPRSAFDWVRFRHGCVVVGEGGFCIMAI